MKITNKKMFIRGIFITACRWYWNIKILYIYRGYAWYSKAVIGIGICLLAALYHMVMALHIDGEDEGAEEK